MTNAKLTKYTDTRSSSFYRFTVKSRKDEAVKALRDRIKKKNKEATSEKRYVKLHPKDSTGKYIYRLAEGVEFDVYVYNYTK